VDLSTMTLKKFDVNTAVRMVDNWRERYPGTIDGHPLKLLAIQKERRLRRIFKGKVKHWIYWQESSKNIWYKNSKDAVGVVKMGFSLRRLSEHPNAVPMEFYHDVFTMPHSLIPISLLPEASKKTLEQLALTGAEWMRLNDYELVV